MKKNNKKAINIVLTVLGLLLLAGGLASMKLFDLGENVLPYLGIGLGCGLFGQGFGELIARRSEKNHPEAARQREIEENDERSIAVRDKAQSRAYRVMIPVFGALLIAFALMNVELKVVLLLAAAYLFVCGCNIYYSVKYGKEM